MASTTFTQSRPIYYDANPSPETMFHLPMSPSEPGKFDFYRYVPRGMRAILSPSSLGSSRVHLANHANHSDSTFSDNSDGKSTRTFSHRATLTSTSTGDILRRLEKKRVERIVTSLSCAHTHTPTLLFRSARTFCRPQVIISLDFH